MIHWLAVAFRTYLLHPLKGNGYQLWSGSGSDLGYLAVLGTFWHRHNCHEARCWRVVRHGRTHCKKHGARDVRS